MLHRTYKPGSLVVVAKSRHDQYARTVHVPTDRSEQLSIKARKYAAASGAGAAGSAASLVALGSKAGKPRAILFGTGVSAGAAGSALSAYKAARAHRKSSKAMTKLSVLHGKAE